MTRHRARWLTLAALALAGCGGSGGPSASKAGGGTGGVSLSIQWPARTARFIPAAANSIVVNFVQGSQVVASTNPPIVRPASTYTLNGIPVGTYSVQVAAYASTTGAGTVLASTTLSGVVIAYNQVTQMPQMTMATTIHKVSVSPATTSVSALNDVTLTATATDASGNVVLVAPSVWKWTSSSAPQATVTASGTDNTAAVIGAATGGVTVTASDGEDPSNPVSGTAGVTVTPESLAVVVSPNAPSGVLMLASQPFTATVSGAWDETVTWSLQEGSAAGSIASNGTYSAGVTAGVYHVVATSNADPTVSASVAVTVFPSQHLVSQPAQTVTATLSSTWTVPNMQTTNWILETAVSPQLATQSNCTTTLTVPGYSGAAQQLLDESPEQRPYLRLVVPTTNGQYVNSLTAAATRTMQLWECQLVAGPPASLAASLDAATLAEQTAAGTTYDFTSSVFQNWLDSSGLRRGANEVDTAFAARVLTFMKATYTYGTTDPSPFTASMLCQASSFDCGGAALLFSATLRANGIPASSKPGRWAASTDPTNGDPEQFHVKAEWYASGIGWIPTDACAAITGGTPSTLVGADPGNFVAFQFDLGMLVDTVYFGVVNVDSDSQFTAMWLTASGGSWTGNTYAETWTVTTTAGRARRVPPRTSPAHHLKPALPIVNGIAPPK